MLALNGSGCIAAWSSAFCGGSWRPPPQRPSPLKRRPRVRHAAANLPNWQAADGVVPSYCKVSAGYPVNGFAVSLALRADGDGPAPRTG